MTTIAIFTCLISMIPLIGHAQDKLTPDEADAKSPVITGEKIAAFRQALEQEGFEVTPSSYERKGGSHGRKSGWFEVVGGGTHRAVRQVSIAAINPLFLDF